MNKKQISGFISSMQFYEMKLPERTVLILVQSLYFLSKNTIEVQYAWVLNAAKAVKNELYREMNWLHAHV